MPRILRLKSFFLFIAFIWLNHCLSAGVYASERKTFSFDFKGKKIEFQLEVLTDKLSHPWSLDFLPDGRMIISERNGQLKLFSQGQLSSPISGTPETFAKSQGGYFDVVLHPEFNDNQTLFLSFAHGNAKNNATRIISARLNGNTLTQQKELLTVSPNKNTPVHYGGRIALLPDNTLLLTTGDGFDFREKAQDLNGLLGKIVRINLDGSIPGDNPFINNSNARNEIYSYGHRNPQGLIYDSVRQKIIMHEHGPAGGDEINYIEAGKNYGWPVITYGKDYSGANISPFTEYPDMQQPLLNWTPSIAPSGLAVYYGKQFEALNGSLLVGALAAKELRIVEMEGDEIKSQVSLLKEMEYRIRDVRVGPDGAIYLLTDSKLGQLIRLSVNQSGSR